MHPSPHPRPYRWAGRWASFAALLAVACDSSAGPVDPHVIFTCDQPAPTRIGEPELLPSDAGCLSFTTAKARYALAYFDGRFVEAARTIHEALAPEFVNFALTVEGTEGTGQIRVPAATPARVPGGISTESAGSHAARPDDWVRLAVSRDDDDDLEVPLGNRADGGDVPVPCDAEPGLEVFCRARPWAVGDTLTLPAPFGLLLHDTPRAAEILLVRGPFAFAVHRGLSEEDRLHLRPILARLALIGETRVIPLLRATLANRPVYTSVGSRQILVDTSFDEEAVCVCGVAVGTYAQGASVSGISIRIPAGATFEGHRVGLFAHELTHVWQHAFDTDRVPDPSVSVAPDTRWATEGGADLIRQETLRLLALEPLDRNRDATVPIVNPFLNRWIHDLGGATGRIRFGYGQTAGLLRHLFVRALESPGGNARYEDVLGALLQGSLEGWYGSPDGSVTGVGLADRLTELWPEFEPTRAVLTYALANAVDDRIRASELRNAAVLEAWRESPGSRFVPAARIDTRGPGVTIDEIAGSVGYVYLDHRGGPTTIRLDADVEGVRWMVVRFE